MTINVFAIQDDGGTDQQSSQDRPASDLSTTKDRSTASEYQDSPTTHQDTPTTHQDTTNQDRGPPVPQVPHTLYHCTYPVSSIPYTRLSTWDTPPLSEGLYCEVLTYCGEHYSNCDFDTG